MKKEREPSEPKKVENLGDDFKSLEISVHDEGLSIAVSSYDQDFQEIKEVVQDLLDGLDPNDPGSQDYIG